MKPTTYQRRIVQTTLPYVEVRASPGSGKTTTLIQRVKHLMRNGVSAQKILVLSFSTETVGELHRRWLQRTQLHVRGSSAKVPGDLAQPVMQTAHAFSRRLLAHAGGSTGVITPSTAVNLLKSALRSCLRDARSKKLWAQLGVAQRQKRVYAVRLLLKDSVCLKQLLSAMEYAKAAQLELRDVMKAPRFAANLESFSLIAPSIRLRYARAKKEAGLVDFGDMLEQAIKFLDSGARIPFTHVLIDEYQDCSAALSQLLAALAKKGCELMVFGDPLQAIYSFGGNSYTPFGEVVEGAIVLPLPDSHRLHRQNAALAFAVAGKRASKILTQRNGAPPVLVHSSDLTGQTRAVVSDIAQLLEQGVDASRIAVLARTRAFLKPIEQRLLAVGMNPAQQGVKRDVLHVLRVLRLVRLIERHERDQEPIDADVLAHVLRKAPTTTQPCWKSIARNLMKAARLPSLEGRYRACEEAYLRVLGGVRANTEVHHDLNRWIPICREHADAIDMRQALKAPDKPVINSMTIHAAKGREWDHVFVVGVADGQLPFYKARVPQMMDEELRLLYVAVTRARNTVRLYHAPQYHARSRKRFEKLSRFLSADAVRRTMHTVRQEKP